MVRQLGDGLLLPVGINTSRLSLSLLHILLCLLIWTTAKTLGDKKELPEEEELANGLDDLKPWLVQSGPWLQEFEEIARKTNGDLDYLQGDDPVEDLQIGVDSVPPLKCPDTPEEKNLLACSQPTCEEDSDCLTARHKCCDNGCVTSCMRGISDSIVVDWEQQPLPQAGEETSWLIPEPDDKKDSNGACFFENRVIPEGIPFQYENHPCVCDSGEVDCDVFPQLPEI